MTRPLQIVVADDDPTVRALVAEWLVQLGHRVTAVADGHALVAACREDVPDLAVSDVRMPVLDGLAAARVLQRELGVPVVLMSCDWSDEQIDRADALGVPRLDKPIRPLALVAAVATTCPPRRATDARRMALVAAAAEELRHPLTPLLNLPRILRAKSDDPYILAEADALDRQVRLMAKLVDELVDAAGRAPAGGY